MHYSNFIILTICIVSLFSCQDNSDLNDLNTDEHAKIVVDQSRFESVWSSLQDTPPPSDQYHLKRLSHQDMQLLIDVSYSGGCEDHDFELVWPEVVTMIYPPRYTVILNHDAHNDSCEAYLSETLTFDLSNYDLGLTSEIIEVMELTIINGSNPDESLRLNQ